MKETVVVLGATGYVGGRLVKELLNANKKVRCVVRNPDRLKDVVWINQVEIVKGDTLNQESLVAGFAGATVVYHLVHAMSDSGDFSQSDRQSAVNVTEAAEKTNVQRIIYLGGLGDPDDPALSNHLSSRHEVGSILAAGSVPVTEHLPAMIVPKWVTKTQCQPISIRDVLYYLVAVADEPSTVGKVLDVGRTILLVDACSFSRNNFSQIGERISERIPQTTECKTTNR